MLKAQNYSLAKTYFHMLKSLTHGKYKLLISQKYFFMGTKLISFHNQPTTKAHVYHLWQNYSFCRDGEAQKRLKGPVEAAQLTCKSQQLKLTWAVKSNFSTTWQLWPITLPCQVDFRHFLCDTKLRWHDIKLGSFSQLSSLSSSTHSIKD